MFRRLTIPFIIVVVTTACCFPFGLCAAQPRLPHAPAAVSWFPHGNGNTMYINNSLFSRMKGVHGLRYSPEYIGSISQPLWGWDVNGYYRGPQRFQPDPADCQLPIGLIYPVNGRALPTPRARKVVAKNRSQLLQAPRRLHVPIRGQRLTNRQGNRARVPVHILASNYPARSYVAPRQAAPMYSPHGRPAHAYAAPPPPRPVSAGTIRQGPGFPAYPRPR